MKREKQMDGPPENDACSICRGNFCVPCQANCGHWFCGNCILQVWENGDVLQPCRCPLCRRDITLFVLNEASLRQSHMTDFARILPRIQIYNRLYGEHPNALVERLRDLRILLQRLLPDMIDPPRSLTKARVCLAIIFCAIIREVLLRTFGRLDNLIFLLLCILYVAAIYQVFFLARHRGA